MPRAPTFGDCGWITALSCVIDAYQRSVTAGRTAILFIGDKSMNMHHLAIFHAVAECGSVTAASRQLHVSQPAISRQLHELEARLGVQLFERQSRGMCLTEVGELLRDYSTRIFALERHAENAVRDYVGLESGSLDIGASQTIGNYLLPEIIARFHDIHPRINVKLTITNSSSIVEGVSDYYYALGFVEGGSPEGAFDVWPWRSDQIVPLVAKNHALARNPPASLEELAAHPVLLRESGSGSRRILDGAFAQRQLQLVCGGEIGNSEALLRAVVAGAGVAWLSELGAADALAIGSVVRLSTYGLEIKRNLYLIRLRDRYLSPSAMAFVDFCKQH